MTSAMGATVPLVSGVAEGRRISSERKYARRAHPEEYRAAGRNNRDLLVAKVSSDLSADLVLSAFPVHRCIGASDLGRRAVQA